MMRNTNNKQNNISNQQLAVLESLSRQPKTISQIAEDTEMSNGQTSQLVTKLHNQGFLCKKRNGNSVTVDFSDHLFAEYLRGLILNDRIDLQNLLRYPCFDILLTLTNRELDKKNVVSETDASEYQVKRCILQLEKKGILWGDRRIVTLSKSLPMLNDFLRSYSSHSNFAKLKELTRKGVILWEHTREFIFFAPMGEHIDNAEVTGISAMSRYDVDIVSDRVYYHCFENGRKLRVEDIALDTILASNFQPRGILYALLFLRKIGDFDRKYLISRGKEIGYRWIAKDLVSFLDGKKVKSDAFPSREEFTKICARYGVNISREDTSRRKTSSTG